MPVFDQKVRTVGVSPGTGGLLTVRFSDFEGEVLLDMSGTVTVDGAAANIPQLLQWLQTARPPVRVLINLNAQLTASNNAAFTQRPL